MMRPARQWRKGHSVYRQCIYQIPTQSLNKAFFHSKNRNSSRHAVVCISTKFPFSSIIQLCCCKQLNSYLKALQRMVCVFCVLLTNLYVCMCTRDVGTLKHLLWGTLGPGTVPISDLPISYKYTLLSLLLLQNSCHASFKHSHSQSTWQEEIDHTG
jgi:hypothetical protein